MFNCTESTLPIRPQAQSADTFPGSWLKRYSSKTNKEFSGTMPQKISRRNQLAGCTFGMETFGLWEGHPAQGAVPIFARPSEAQVLFLGSGSGVWDLQGRDFQACC